MASKHPKTALGATSTEGDLSQHPAVTTYVTPPVTKPLLSSLQIPEVPNEGEARLHWLLDINQQFFAWELQQIVSINFFYTVLFYREAIAS